MKIFFFLSAFTLCAWSKNIAYIHGDIAADGTIPSGSAPAYDQMLLDDSGRTGLTLFAELIRGEGYTISQFYDQETTLNAAFLNQFDAIIFGLHQVIWDSDAKEALDLWLRAGGGMLIYSDSASGGRFSEVGIDNDVGQRVTNNLISRYGMEVTVDQGGGTRSYIPENGNQNPIIWDQPDFEGEGVSPVAVDRAGEAEILIPLLPANRTGGRNLNINSMGISFSNFDYAAMALAQVGKGNVISIFDRQPMWNDGPGSDILKRDNREILRRTIRFLARDYGNSPEWLNFRLSSDELPLELSWNQWKGGTGNTGIDYLVRNSEIVLEYSPDLTTDSWQTSSVTLLETTELDDEVETVRVSISNSPSASQLFTRLRTSPIGSTPEAIIVEAGQDRIIGENGRVSLEPELTGGNGALTASWAQTSGPGTVTFDDATSAITTATFSTPGIYELTLTVTDSGSSEQDTITIRSVATNEIVTAINCGNLNDGHTGLNGINYRADTDFSDGRTDTFPNNAVAGTEDDLLYNYARSGFDNYSITLPNGNYTVYFQFAETFFTEANRRVFNIDLEGQRIITELDLVATTTGKWISYDLPFSTTVSDGALTINSSALVNNSLLNAIVVIAE